MSGFAIQPVALPLQAGLGGVQLFAQAGALDPGGAVSLSPVLRIVVGD